MADNKRLKAQDVFNNADYFLGKGTFVEAFSEIDTICLEYTEIGSTLRRYIPYETDEEIGYRFKISDKNRLGEFINCSNSLCYNGGFNIGHEIREMVRNREESREGEAYCQGYEGSPKGKKRYGNCDNHFKYRITIKYKD